MHECPCQTHPAAQVLLMGNRRRTGITKRKRFGEKLSCYIDLAELGRNKAVIKRKNKLKIFVICELNFYRVIVEEVSKGRFAVSGKLSVSPAISRAFSEVTGWEKSAVEKQSVSIKTAMNESTFLKC